MGQCKWKSETSESIQCARQSCNGNYCILHDKDEKKDQEIFNAGVRAVLMGEDVDPSGLQGTCFVTTRCFERHRLRSNENLSETTWHCDINLPSNVDPGGTSRARVVFRSATFMGTVNFVNWQIGSGDFSFCKFESEAVFRDCTFEPGLHFVKCHFRQMITFDGASVLNKVRISDVVFSQGISLRQTLAFADVLFDNVAIEGPSEFVWGTDPQQVTFGNTRFAERTRLSVAFSSSRPTRAVSFIGCNLSKLQITGIARHVNWSAARSLEFARARELFWPFRVERNALWDELTGLKNEEVILAYRDLHARFYEECLYDRASDFYIGYMRADRFIKGGRWSKRLTGWFYEKFSRYGESVWRPLSALIIMWLGVPALKIAADQAGDSTTAWGNLCLSQRFELYLKAVVWNLYASTMLRSAPADLQSVSWFHSILIMEMLLVIVFVGLLILGIRRKFVPRKPIELPESSK